MATYKTDFPDATFDGNTLVPEQTNHPGDVLLDVMHPNRRMVEYIDVLRAEVARRAEADGLDAPILTGTEFLMMVFGEAWLGTYSLLRDVLNNVPGATERADTYLRIGFDSVGDEATLAVESLRVNVTETMMLVDDAE